jgi:hypothetical protein
MPGNGDGILPALDKNREVLLNPTLTVDGYMETDVIHFFPGGYEKIPRTRIGKKRQPRYMD